MIGECAVCGARIVILHGTEPSEHMLRCAIEAYLRAGRVDDAADFEHAMREALAAALEEA